MPRIIITEPGKSPQPYRLKIERDTSRIGRGADNDIQIEAGSASTNHCVMKRVPGGFILEDLGSTNGIKVGDTLYSVIDLVDGTLIKIGDDVTLEFTLSEEELEALDSEEFQSQQKVQLPKINETPASEDLEEESFDEEVYEETPKPEQQAATAVAAKAKSGIGSLLFLILAVGALALGFYIRHKQDVLLPAKEAAPIEDVAAESPASDAEVTTTPDEPAASE